MNSRVTASIVAEFDGRNGQGSEGSSIEPDPRFYNDGLWHLLLYPPDPGWRLHADIGEAWLSDTTTFQVPSGAVQFSGGKVANLPKRPAGGSPELHVHFAFGLDGVPITISPTYDRVENLLRIDRECFAVVSYAAYAAAALKITYRPREYALGSGGRAQEFGAISAFNTISKALVIYQVNPAFLTFGDDKLELYRVVSQELITPDGAFEVPPNWPESGTWPGMSFNIPVGVGIVTEVSHEIGYMDMLGRAEVKTYNVRNLEPFVGSLNYKRPKRSVVSSVDDKYPRELQLKALDFIKSKGLGPKP